MDEFECADTDENSGVKAIDDHTLHVRVSLTNTSNSFKSGTELSSLTDESSVIRYGNYRSNSNFSEDESAQHQRTNSFKSFGKIEKGGFSNTMMDVKSFQTPKKIQGPGIPKSNSSHTYKFFAKKFEENFNREVEKLNVFAEISKEILVKILHALRFLAEPSETNEANDLFGLLEKCSTQSYLKSLLQTILKIKSENSLLSPMEAAEVKDRFPLMYSNFFKAKRKSYTVEQPSFSPNTTPRSSFTYQIVKKHLKSTEKYKTQAEQLRAYELTLEAKFERSIEKVNKEKYKECTFKPKINKKSKLLDSSPKVLRTNNTSPYLNLKDCKPSTNRTDILYEFAEVSRKLKEVKDI